MDVHPKTTTTTTTPIVKAFSEGDLRVFCNGKKDQITCKNDSICCESTETINGIRADYILLEASKTNHNKKRHSFRKKLLQKSSTFYETNDKFDTSVAGTNTIVVVPSIDLDGQELKSVCKSVEYYEERQLYHLFLLRDPSFRVIFLSTYPINHDIVRYYLSLDNCNESELNDRLGRLFLLTPGNYTPNTQSLSKKVVNDPKLISTIKNIVCKISRGQAPSAGLNVFCGSEAADKLAYQLNLRLLEASFTTLYYGTKQGSREIFRSCFVPHAPGTPDIGDDDLLTELTNADGICADKSKCIRDSKSLAIGLARQIVLKRNKPKLWVIKLNQGFSGKGNAMLDLQSIQTKTYINDVGGKLIDAHELVNAMAEDIESSFPKMKFTCPCATWNSYRPQLKRLGVIAEMFLEGKDISSPSVQAIIEPDCATGNHCVHILSTHEQILDDGQIFSGCINPANGHYRKEIITYAKRIGNALADKGVVGHFATDFLTNRRYNKEGEIMYDVSAIEINLRQGGTTHTFATMALLCGGETGDDGVFRTQDGQQRCYVATDNFLDANLSGITSKDFLHFFYDGHHDKAKSVRWDSERKLGVIFHILDFIPFGKVGFTAIAESPSEANKLFQSTVELLKKLV